MSASSGAWLVGFEKEKRKEIEKTALHLVNAWNIKVFSKNIF